MDFFNVTFVQVSVLASVFVSVPAVAQEEIEKQTNHKKYLMASMGDSLTAGFLASTYLNWFNSSNLTLAQEAQDFVAIVESTSGGDLARGQFSWTGEFAHLFETRTTKSWATGTEVGSHYVRLSNAIHKTEPTAKISAINVALTGGLTSDLYEQVDAIVKEMKTGHYAALKYVTLLIGNNDACQNKDQNQMKADLHNIFSRLAGISQGEPIRVLMSGIPRIPDLGENAVGSSQTLFKYSCRAFRNSITRTCLPLTGWSKEAQYIDLIQYAQSVNEALSDAADQANADFKNLDVRFSNVLFDVPITKENLAVDCFHPNATSQAEIAAALWQNQPWYSQ